MFRRSRFNLKPNVGRAAAATTQEAPSSNQVAGEPPGDAAESIPAAVTDTSPAAAPSEKNTGPGDGNEHNVDGTGSKAAVQRRKRFSVKPKVAPGRPSTGGRTPKSPVKAIPAAPVGFPESDLDRTKAAGQTETAAAPQGLRSPKGRRSSTAEVASPTEQSLEQTNKLTDNTSQPESRPLGQVKDVPTTPEEKLPFSIPDKEAVELAEKAKSLVTSRSGLSLSPSAMSLSRLLNDPSDLQRLAKAQKLRELLRQEKHKEKKCKKTRSRIKDFTIDPTKMTMGDLIRYLPLSNPMKSSVEEETLENEIVVPSSPVSQPYPDNAKEPEDLPKVATPTEEEEGAEDEQDEDVMVPQVKVAEDGSLIIDEESLTVEVQRAKGPNPADGRDAIFERGSTTTYSSFRKGTYSKPWSSEETDMFYLAVSMVGTDFTMICQLFPHRTRSEIKNKFKKEERENAWRIDKAFKERRQLDIEYFSKLLEKILEFQKNRKKLRSLTKKNSPKKKKAKGKKASMKLSDVEEGEEEDASEVPDLEDDDDEEEGEKENEELCNEDGTSESKPKRRGKRKTQPADLKEELNDEKRKRGEKGHGQDEACVLEGTEATLPEDLASAHMSEQTENMDPSRDSSIKPAKLSRARPPKPLLPLGRKYGKKPPPPAANSNDATFHNEDHAARDTASKEQVVEDSSPLKQANVSKTADGDISSEEEDATVQPPRPTRYGRVPKPTKPLNYPAKEEPYASDATPGSPVGSAASAGQTKPNCAVKRARATKQQSAQESKKPKLVTLRASRSDYSDDEEDTQQGLVEIEEEEEQQPACSLGDEGLAPVFVPASLRSPHPVISEVEETMEELDILASMPNVLDISQDAMCPDASCERAQKEMGTAEPCEHQLDLLVDVIDFLSTEHTEECEDESYNEAAQTLLTIGNPTHLSQSSDNALTPQSSATGKDTVGVKKNRQNQDVIPAQEDASCSHLLSGQERADKSETSATVEQQHGTTDGRDVPVIDVEETCQAQKLVSDLDASPRLQSSPRSSSSHLPQITKKCSSRVKPKPNLGRSSRSAQPKSDAGTSAEKTAVSNSQVSGTPSTPEKSTIKVQEYSQTSIIEDASSANEKHEWGEIVGQVECGGETTDLNSSQGNLQPSSRKQVNEDTGSTSVAAEERQVPHTEIFFSNNLTPDIAESQAAKMSSTVSVQQGGAHPADIVGPVDNVDVRQKEEGEVASTCHPGGSRFQKVKPKPNLTRTSRAARSAPTASKDLAGTHSSPPPTPIAEIHEQSMVVVKQSGNCGTVTENPCQTAKQSTDGLVCPPDPISATASPSAAGQQHLFEEILEPDGRDATSGSAPVNQSTDHAESQQNAKQVTSVSAVTASQTGQVDCTASTSGQRASENEGLSEAMVQVADAASTSGSADFTVATSAKDLTASPKDKSEVAPASPVKRSRLQRVKPKPNLAQTSRAAPSRPQTTEEPAAHVPVEDGPVGSNPKTRPSGSTMPGVESQPIGSVALPVQSSSTDSLASPESGKTDTPTEDSPATVERTSELQLNVSSNGSEPNKRQRRQHLPKIKPNLGPSTRPARTKPTEQHHTGAPSNASPDLQPLDNTHTELKPSEKDDKHLTTHCQLNTELGSTQSAPATSEKTLDGTGNTRKPSDGISTAASRVAGNQSTPTRTIPGNKSIETPTLEMESSGHPPSSSEGVDSGPVSRGYCELDMSTKFPESNTPTRSYPSAAPATRTPEGGCTESAKSSVLASKVHSATDPQDVSPQPCSKSDSEVKSCEAGQQCSRARETDHVSRDMSQSLQSTEGTALADSPKTPKKAPQIRRARLFKPKPNLGHSSRTPQAQQVQQPRCPNSDSGAQAEGAHASVSPKPVSEPRPVVKEPVAGAVEPPQSRESLSKEDTCQTDTVSSVGRVTQRRDDSSQNTSTSPTEGSQIHPSLPVCPDSLSGQSPSDPEEPFFILSLTEIPVVVSRATDSCTQQQSVPEVALATAAEGSLLDAPESVGTEERVRHAGPHLAAYKDVITKDPADPQGYGGTTAQPSSAPETVEIKTEPPPTKHGLGSQRRAKPQVKPNATRKRNAGKAFVSDTSQESDPAGPGAAHVKTIAGVDADTEARRGSGVRATVEKRSVTDGKGPVDGSTAPQSRTTSSTNNKQMSVMSSEPSPRAASTERADGRTRRARQGPAPAQAASASHAVPSTPAQQEGEVRSVADIHRTTVHGPLSRGANPSTSQSTAAELSTPEQSDREEGSSVEEEPTNVSQYFLSDIFTEVEEG